MRPEPISNIDAAILNVEDPTAPDTMGLLMLFKGKLDEEQLLERINYAWLRYPRYRQKIRRRPFGRMEWVEDPSFDIRAHIRRVAVPAPNDNHALQRVVGDLMGILLDRSKPLWSMHILEGGQGGDALLIRVHHALGDGVTLLTTGLGLFRDRFMIEPDTKDETLVGRIIEPIGEMFHATQMVGNWIRQQRESGRPKMEDLLATAEQALTLGLKMFPLIQDPSTSLTGKLGRVKHVSWTPPVPAKELKRVSRAFGVTTNDLMLALIAGTLRRYFIAQEEPVPTTLHASVPVYLSDTMTLGNNFGLVLAPLPVGEADPTNRVMKVHDSMEKLKKSPEAELVQRAFNMAGQLPPGFVSRAFDEISRKATVIVTNIPGPPMALDLAGTTMECVIPLVPLSGHIGIGIAICSYNRTMTLGIQADAERVKPNLRAFIEHLRGEMAMLTSLADTATDKNLNQCVALTLIGHRCRNKPRIGKNTCYIHRYLEDERLDAQHDKANGKKSTARHTAPSSDLTAETG